MTATLELYDQFWKCFRAAIPDDDEFLSPEFKSPHGNRGYIEFPKCVGESFRLRATLAMNSGSDGLLNRSRLQAQLWTCRKLGIAFVREFRDKGIAPLSDPSAPGVARWHLNQTDAKIELEWQGADLANPAFWPAHHLWLRIALKELATALERSVMAFEDSNR